MTRSFVSLFVFASAVTSTLASAAAQYPVTKVVDFPLHAPDGGGPDVVGIVSLNRGLDTDAGGAWVTIALVPQGSSTYQAVYGVVPPLGVTTPGLVRQPATIAGLVQRDITRAQIRGSSMAYTARLDDGTVSTWVDDQLIARSGDPLGTTGLFLTGADQIEFGLPGEYYVCASATTGAPFAPTVGVVLHYPSQTILLAGGDTLDGLNGAPMLVGGGVEVSPDGSHWAATIGYDADGQFPAESAIVVDGALYRFGGVTPAMTGAQTTLGYGSSFFGDWVSFELALVTNEGDLTFEAMTETAHVIVRNLTPVVIEPPIGSSRLLDHDASGRALVRDWNGEHLGLSVDGVALARTGVAGIDADANGAVDPGWQHPVLGGFAAGAAFQDDGTVLAQTGLTRPDGVGELVFVTAEMALPTRLLCAGTSNQTGWAAGLRWLGTSRPAFNDLVLSATELPVGTLLVPIFSRDTAVVPMAGGGIGTLCLGGAIGRGAPINVVTVSMRDLEIPVFTNAMPQPNGAVSALAGETWHAQVWYRDAVQGVATSNFSDAVSITFE